MDKHKRKRLRKQKRKREMEARRREAEKRDADELREIGAEPEAPEKVPQFPGFRPGVIPPHIKKKQEQAEKEAEDDDFDPGPEAFMTGGGDD